MDKLKKTSKKIVSIGKKMHLDKPARWVCDYICDYIRAMAMASTINIRLEKYKGKNAGKNVYIIGGGPSVSNFKHKKTENDIYIGINRTFKDKRFELDYIFVQDQLPEGFEELISYRGGDCTKFLAIIPSNEPIRIKEYAIQGEYERYVLASRRMKSVPVDISLEPFADLRGTVFSALQFAVYTNPENIYLVGIDCSSSTNIYNSNSDDYRYQFESWKIMKKALIDIGAYDKMISVNPIGLKGLFNDLYTD